MKEPCCQSTTYLHCILKDNAKQNKSMVLEYKIKKDAAKFR